MDFNTLLRVGAADADDVTDTPVDVFDDEAAIGTGVLLVADGVDGAAVDGVDGVDGVAEADEAVLDE